MPRLDGLGEAQRNMLLTRPVEVNDGAPFVKPVPLERARFAIVTSAGLHLRDDRPFVRDDPSYRTIPSTAAPSDILQSHSSIGFDRGAAIADLNVVFPLDRLREMQARGRIGPFAARFFSFMGAQRDLTRMAETTGPEVARSLRDDGVDIVLLTPT